MLRFTIRDVLWLTMVAGCVTALVVTRAQFNIMQQEIDRQSERLLWKDAAILELANGWQKDRPDRIEFEDHFISINGDESRTSFDRPGRSK